jgi:ubiquinone/menaquinone biosynthesis C-methylase UbiE
MTKKKFDALASPLPEARRIHDEKVYLAEDRSDKPKEIFKQVRNIFQGWYGSHPGPVELLDVGSATGDFLSFVAREFPDWRLTGLDVSERMIAESRQRIPKAQFIEGSLLDQSCLAGKQFDVITCMGVLSIFDSLEEPLGILTRALKPKGLLIIFGQMNEYAMDVLVRCRYAHTPDEPWQIGYNAFSREYYERVLGAQERKMTYTWQKFLLPIDLPRSNDLLRNWTVSHGDDPRQQMRGTSQLSTQYILQIQSD